MPVYVSDYGNHAIRTTSPSGFVKTVAGRGGISGYADGAGTAALLSFPTGLALDSAGSRLFIADSGSALIRTMSTSAPYIVRTIAGGGGTCSFSSGCTRGSLDATGTAATFSADLGGLTFDPMVGILFVADASNNEIRAVYVSSRAVATVAGNTTAGSINGARATSSGFRYPFAVTLDEFSGNLIVSDYGNGKLRYLSR